MKKILFGLLVLISFNSFAQDATVVRNLPLQARVIEYVTPYLANLQNDDLYTVFLDVRTKFRATKPQGNTLVSIDSIPTVELANLYNYTLSSPEGMSVANILQNQIQSVRTANSYLNRLCTAYEDAWKERLRLIRIEGRRLLIRKN